MHFKFNKLCLYFVFHSLLNLVTSLDPSGYGINPEQLVQAPYKAAYARAKEMREMQFANKAASGNIGPTEEIMQETYQVIFIFFSLKKTLCFRRDTPYTWSRDLNHVSLSRIYKWIMFLVCNTQFSVRKVVTRWMLVSS